MLARGGLNGAWGAIREENSHQPQSIFTGGAHYHFMESPEADKAAAFPTAARKSPAELPARLGHCLTGEQGWDPTGASHRRHTLHLLQSAASRVTHQPLNPLPKPLGDAGTFILRFPEPQVANRSRSALGWPGHVLLPVRRAEKGAGHPGMLSSSRLGAVAVGFWGG